MLKETNTFELMNSKRVLVGEYIGLEGLILELGHLATTVLKYFWEMGIGRVHIPPDPLRVADARVGA